MSGSERHPDPGGDALHGLSDASLRRVLHDLRGPMNTISILGEVLRGRLEGVSDAPDDVVAMIVKTVQDMSAMVDRVRGVLGTMPARTAPVALRPAIEAAAGRAAGVRTDGIEGGEHARVMATEAALAAFFDAAYRCCGDGAAVRVRVGEDEAGRVRVRFERIDGGAPFPDAASRAHLVAGREGALEWFEWTCRVEGLGGEFVVPDGSPDRAVEVALPRG